MYEDLWTAAKGAYKTEPVVADGGEIIIYAPHVREVSHVHGRLIEEIGYHCRDYFLAQWERFGGYPGGILAHSTHVKGQGTYDAVARRRNAAKPRDAGDGHRPGDAANGSTSATAIRLRSTRRRGSPKGVTTRSSCRAPAKCCIGSEPRRES